MTLPTVVMPNVEGSGDDNPQPGFWGRDGTLEDVGGSTAWLRLELSKAYLDLQWKE